MNKEERVIEVDLVQLIKAVWDKAVYILIAMLIFGIAGYAGSKFLKTPIYQATAKLIVNTQSVGSQDVSSDRVNSAKALVDTYAAVLCDRDAINQVIDELELTENYAALRECISIKSVNNTQVMQIVVRHPNQATAYAVAEKMQYIAPNFVAEHVGIGTLKIAGQTYASPNPVSPNNKMDALLAAVIGFALSCSVVLTLHLMDNTYKSDADIQDDLGVLVLGVIPKVECCGKYRKYGYGYAYGYGYGYGYGHSHKSKNQKKEGK